MASKWLNALEVDCPALAQRAKYLNRRDNYVMKYDPEEMKRKDQRKREKRRAAKEWRREQIEKQSQQFQWAHGHSGSKKLVEASRQGSPSSVSDIERELNRGHRASRP